MGSSVISERGFVATRQGIDALREQLHAEALRRVFGPGCQRAGHWGWRGVDLAIGRRPAFPAATFGLLSRRATSGGGGTGAPWRRQGKISDVAQAAGSAHSKNQSALKVIGQLEAALAQMPGGTAAQTAAKEVAYFHEHQARIGYRAGRRAGEPIGSGPVEATCRQTRVSVQTTGTVLEQARRRSLALSGNVLAQRSLASPIPSYPF